MLGQAHQKKNLRLCTEPRSLTSVAEQLAVDELSPWPASFGGDVLLVDSLEVHVKDWNNCSSHLWTLSQKSGTAWKGSEPEKLVFGAELRGVISLALLQMSSYSSQQSLTLRFSHVFENKTKLEMICKRGGWNEQDEREEGYKAAKQARLGERATRDRTYIPL